MCADTVSHPDAMVVMPGNACFAEAAVFTSRWLQKPTSAAAIPRVEENVVIGVSVYFFCMVSRVDEGLSGKAFV